MNKSQHNDPKIQLEVEIKTDEARKKTKELAAEADALQKAFTEDFKATRKLIREKERAYEKEKDNLRKIQDKLEKSKVAYQKSNAELVQTSHHLNTYQTKLKLLQKQKAELIKKGGIETQHAKQLNAEIISQQRSIDLLLKRATKQEQTEKKKLGIFEQQTKELEEQHKKMAQIQKDGLSAKNRLNDFSPEGKRFKAVESKRKEAQSSFVGMDVNKMNIRELGRLRSHVEETMKIINPDDPQLKGYQEKLQKIIDRTKELRRGKDALAIAHENSTKKLKKEIEEQEEALSLMDRSSKEYKKAVKEIKKLNEALERSEKGWSKTQQKLHKGLDILKNPISKLGPIGAGVAGLSALAVKAYTAIISKAREFEQAMAGVKAVTNATDSEFKKLKLDAKRLGATTKYTATEVAGLQKAYGKLGFTTDEILNATGATLALASATGEDLSKSAAIAGATLRGFGLDASEMTRVTDVMADSFTKSALDLSSFSEAMKYVAPVAAAAGISIEEATAMLSSMADAGIKGSQAGTSLRRIITDLGAGAEPLSQKLHTLNQKGITLSQSMDEVGRTAQTALLVLSKNTDKIDNLTDAYDKSAGAAKRMAAIQGDTLTGSLTRLSSAWEGFLLSMEDGSGWLAKATRGVIDFATETLGLVTVQETAAQAMENERISVNALVLELRHVNTSAERKKDIYNELLKINPKLVAGINLEKISYEQLNKNLEAYNKLTLDRIASEQIQTEINANLETAVAKKKQQAKAQRDLNEALTRASELLRSEKAKEIISSTSLNDLERAKLMVEELKESLAGLNGAGGAKGRRKINATNEIKYDLENAVETFKETQKEIEERNKQIEKLTKEQENYKNTEDKKEVDLKSATLTQLLELEKKYSQDKYAFTHQELQKEIKLKRDAFEAIRKITLNQLKLGELKKLNQNFDETKGYSFTKLELAQEISQREKHSQEITKGNKELQKRTEAIYRAMLKDKEDQLEAQRDLEIKEILMMKATEKYKLEAIEAVKQKYNQLIVTERKTVLTDLMEDLEKNAAKLNEEKQKLSPDTKEVIYTSRTVSINQKYDEFKTEAETARDAAASAGDTDTAAEYNDALDQIELQRKQELNNLKLEQEKGYQERIKEIREEAEAYWLEHDEEKALLLLEKQQKDEEEALTKQQTELGKLDEFEALKAKITEKYAKKKDETEEYFLNERLRKYAEYVQVASQYIAAVGNAFSAAKQHELAAAGDNEEKKKQIMKKYADVEMGVQIAQAVGSAALAVLRVWSDLGPWGAAVMAPIVATTTGFQVASMIQERNRIKGLAEGGEIDVTREQDGKQFKATKTNKRGFIEKPSVLVAEEGKEYVIPNNALENPEIAAFVNEIEQARVSKTLPQMNFERINTAITETRGYQNGGFINSTQTATTQFDEEDRTDKAEGSSNQIEVLLRQILEESKKPKKNYIVLSELLKLQDEQKSIEAETSINF